MKRQFSTAALVAPMMFAYFVMGFMDIVGISTSYITADFADRYPMEVFGFVPTALFLWFLILAVPTGIAMNHFGRKNIVLASMLFTLVGVIVPIVYYSFVGCMVAFALMGIGNTMLQVSINPLLSNVVSGKQMTSTMTIGQFCRSLCSLSGPYIALAAVSVTGQWHYVFAIYALITLAATLWLLLTPVPREQLCDNLSVSATFSLLKDPYIVMLFVAMMAFLGVDIGTNTESAQLLMWRLGLDPLDSQSVQQVGYAPVPYFACRIVGALTGVWILSRYNNVKYFRLCCAMLMCSVAGLMIVPQQWLILTFIGIIGFACSSMFPIILYAAMKRYPGRSNEVSGLMITAICGGAVVTPLMSFAARLSGSREGSLAVLLVMSIYLLFTSVILRTEARSTSIEDC